MTDLVQFHQKGGLWYAFLGVHVIGLVTENGRWMFALDGNATWRRSAGDLENGKAALKACLRQWYDGAHQPLAPGQAERLCQAPQTLRPKREVQIVAIEPEAIALRLKRDGVVTTYVMPPVAEGLEAPKETILSARAYCISAAAVAEAKLRAAPADRLAEHEFGVFNGLVHLIDACRSSLLIKHELQRISQDRAAESTRVEDESDQTDGAGADSSTLGNAAE